MTPLKEIIPELRSLEGMDVYISEIMRSAIHNSTGEVSKCIDGLMLKAFNHGLETGIKEIQEIIAPIIKL